MITIGFTGTRKGLRIDQIDSIIKVFDKYTNIIAIHGDCVGADTDFHRICLKYRIEHPDKKLTINIFPPIDNKLRKFNIGDYVHEPADYLDRNMSIIKASDIIIACPLDKQMQELRSGTWFTIRQARKRKMQLLIF